MSHCTGADSVSNLEQLDLGNAVNNSLILQAFKWHTTGRQWARLQLALHWLKNIGIDKPWIPPGWKAMDPLGNGHVAF